MGINTGQKKLKIGYLWQYEAGDLSPTAATSLHMRAVVDRLRKRGHQVRVVTVHSGQPSYSDDLETWSPIQSEVGKSRSFRTFESGVRWIQNRLGLPYLRFFESHRFSGAVQQALQGYDLCYERFWLNGYGGLLAARRMKIPVIYEVNGDIVEEYRQLGIQLSPLEWSFIHWITRRVFQNSARVITVSETLRQTSIQRWKLDPERVTTVPNGADVERFILASDGTEQMRDLGLNGSVVMFIGSFKPWHGLDLLVEAFAQLAKKNPQARLVLVGDGLTRKELEEQSQQLGVAERVTFTGPRPHEEIPVLLQQAQVVVLNPRSSPASKAGSPLKLFEYMAASKAIVAPAQANFQEVLVDRQNALLFEEDRTEQLAGAIEELLCNPKLRQRLGENARRQASGEHSWDRTVDRLERIFFTEIDGG